MKSIFFCFVIFFFVGCQKEMIVTRKDKSIVCKCWNGACENLIVFISEKDDAWTWYNEGVTCKELKNYKHLAVIIDKSNPDYEYYKLKYESCKQGVIDFNKFYDWYLKNKDKRFDVVISETSFESSVPTTTKHEIDNSTYNLKPIYEDKTYQTPINVGRTLTYRKQKRTTLVGFKHIKNEDKRVVQTGTTYCKIKVTHNYDAMTYYIKQKQ